MLDRQFERQALFTQQYINEMRPTASKVELTKEYVLSLHREADEILDEVPWKGHRVYDEGDDQVVKTNVAEEIVDLIKFATGLAYIWGISHQELVQELDVKSDVVEDRWRQEHGKSTFLQSETPIVLLDLDGVLNMYPAPFLSFIYNETGQEFRSMADLEDKDPVLKAQMKHLYRQSGVKRFIESNQESVMSAQILAAAGYNLVIMSQRPAEAYHRIYGDTLYWLRRNDIPYERLVFVQDKQLRLLLMPYRKRIAFAVDDSVDVVRSLVALGIKTYHLAGIDEDCIVPGVKDVESMLQIPEVQSSTAAFRRKIRRKL